MNNPTNYSWSFNLSSPQNKKQTEQSDKFAFDLCYENPLSGDLVLVRSQRTGKQAILKADALFVLKHCCEFRTIESHIQQISSKFAELRSNPDEVRQVLLTTRDAGLLISHQEIINKLSASTAESSPEAVPIICIPTCDRPDALQRLLFSIQENCTPNEFSHCIVIDDSRTEESRSQNEAIVQKAQHTLSFRVIYFGLSQQKQLQSALVALLPELSSEINFLIGNDQSLAGVTHGRSRNFALLLSVGQNVLLLDDDILCQAIDPPTPDNSVEISLSPREAEFYGLKEDWPHQKPATNSNPLTPHTQHLGMPLSTTLQKLTYRDKNKNQLKIESTNAIEQLNAQSKILITACGSYGDPGTSNREWIYHLPEATRKRLYESEEKYHQAKTIRNNWLGRSGYHLTNSITLISQITGLHNNTLLPPYFPLLRNEDYLFGEMTRFIHPDSLALDLPYAVPHLPLEKRECHPLEKQFLINPGFLRITGNFVADKKDIAPSNEASSRLKILAYLFENLAATPNKLLRNALKQQIMEIRTVRYNSLLQILQESPDAPDFWKEDIKQLTSIYQSALTTEDELSIFDIPGASDETELLDYMTTSWRQFGKALLAWPQIREAGATIIKKGLLK